MNKCIHRSSSGQPTLSKTYWPFRPISWPQKAFTELPFVHDKGLLHRHFLQSLLKKNNNKNIDSTRALLYNNSRLIWECRFPPCKSKSFLFKNNFEGSVPHIQTQHSSLQVLFKWQTRREHHNIFKPFGISESAKKFGVTLLGRWTSLRAPPDLTHNHSSFKSATKASVVSNYLPLCKNVNFMLCKHISLRKTSLPIKIAFDSLMTIFCSKWLKQLSVSWNICSLLQKGEDTPTWHVYRWATYNDLYRRKWESLGTYLEQSNLTS